MKIIYNINKREAQALDNVINIFGIKDFGREDAVKEMSSFPVTVTIDGTDDGAQMVIEYNTNFFVAMCDVVIKHADELKAIFYSAKSLGTLCGGVFSSIKSEIKIATAKAAAGEVLNKFKF